MTSSCLGGAFPDPDLVERVSEAHAAAIGVRQRLVPDPHGLIAASGVAVDPLSTPETESLNP